MLVFWRRLQNLPHWTSVKYKLKQSQNAFSLSGLKPWSEENKILENMMALRSRTVWFCYVKYLNLWNLKLHIISFKLNKLKWIMISLGTYKLNNHFCMTNLLIIWPCKKVTQWASLIWLSNWLLWLVRSPDHDISIMTINTPKSL